MQASGIGLRKATDLALPAFVSSTIKARPLVRMLANSLLEEGLLPDGFQSVFEEHIGEATRGLIGRRCESGATRARDAIEEATAEAETSAQSMLEGRTVRRDQSQHYGHPSEALVQPAGGEDPEREKPTGLQGQLSEILDDELADRLSDHLARSQRWSDMRRVRELRDPTVSHDWLWALHPAHGACVPVDEFATCLRIRLGAFMTDEPVICERCSTEMVD